MESELTCKVFKEHLFEVLYTELRRAVYTNKVEAYLTFIHYLVLNTKPYLIMGNEGLEKITEFIFGNEKSDYIDFTFQIKSSFFGGLSLSTDDVENLITLILSSSVENINELSAIPDVWTGRLAANTDDVNMDEHRTILHANLWLIPLFLICLWIDPMVIPHLQSQISDFANEVAVNDSKLPIIV